MFKNSVKKQSSQSSFFYVDKKFFQIRYLESQNVFEETVCLN